MTDDEPLKQIVWDARQRHVTKLDALSEELKQSPVESVAVVVRLNRAVAATALALLDRLDSHRPTADEDADEVEFAVRLANLDAMSERLDDEGRKDYGKKREFLIKQREVLHEGQKAIQALQGTGIAFFTVAACRSLSEINAARDFAQAWRTLERLVMFGLGCVPIAWPACALRLLIDIVHEGELRTEDARNRADFHTNYFFAVRRWAIAVEAYFTSGKTDFAAAAKVVDDRIAEAIGSGTFRNVH